MVGRIVGHGPKTRYLIDGQEVTREVFEESFPDKPLGDGTGLIGWNPLASESLAVNPKQIAAAKEDAQKKGLGQVEFTKDGRPIFESRAKRAAYMNAYGYFDRNGGYGDAQPGQSKRIKDLPPAPDPATLYGEAPIRVTAKGKEQLVQDILRQQRRA
jgi:hypothetical protein